MQNIQDIPVKEIAAGISGKYIHGAYTTLGYVEIKSGSVLALHHHVHEQITFVIQGQLEMNIGGQTILLSPGDTQVIPSGTPHSAIAQADCIVVDVFSPARDDYR
jgi:quercetin dioxygenase-like cupin family protein